MKSEPAPSMFHPRIFIQDYSFFIFHFPSFIFHFHFPSFVFCILNFDSWYVILTKETEWNKSGSGEAMSMSIPVTNEDDGKRSTSIYDLCIFSFFYVLCFSPTDIAWPNLFLSYSAWSPFSSRVVFLLFLHPPYSVVVLSKLSTLSWVSSSKGFSLELVDINFKFKFLQFADLFRRIFV